MQKCRGRRFVSGSHFQGATQKTASSYKNSSMLLIMRGSPPAGGERGSAVRLAYWTGLEEGAVGGGDAAAERSIFKSIFKC